MIRHFQSEISYYLKTRKFINEIKTKTRNVDLYCGWSPSRARNFEYHYCHESNVGVTLISVQDIKNSCSAGTKTVETGASIT